MGRPTFFICKVWQIASRAIAPPCYTTETEFQQPFVSLLFVSHGSFRSYATLTFSFWLIEGISSAAKRHTFGSKLVLYCIDQIQVQRISPFLLYHKNEWAKICFYFFRALQFLLLRNKRTLHLAITMCRKILHFSFFESFTGNYIHIILNV